MESTCQIVVADGPQLWFIKDKLHRENGPAIIWSDGVQEWYINGNNITESVNEWMQKQNVSWPWDEETQAQFILTFC